MAVRYYVTARLPSETHRSRSSLLMTSLIALLAAFATNSVSGVAVVVAESETGVLRFDAPVRMPAAASSLNRSLAPSDGFDEQTAAGSGIDRRRNVIRGESEAAVITRLPVMKTELCRAERLEQTVKERGCIPRTVVNRYCYGQCNSFYIPRPATQTANNRKSHQHNRRHHRQQQRLQHSVHDRTGLHADAVVSDAGLEPVQTGRNRRREAAAIDSAVLPAASGPSGVDDVTATELGWTAFKSCSFCRPKRVAWITIGLSCPGRQPPYRRRRVQIVKECACTALTLD